MHHQNINEYKLVSTYEHEIISGLNNSYPLSIFFFNEACLKFNCLIFKILMSFSMLIPKIKLISYRYSYVRIIILINDLVKMGVMHKRAEGPSIPVSYNQNNAELIIWLRVKHTLTYIFYFNTLNIHLAHDPFFQFELVTTQRLDPSLSTSMEYWTPLT